MKVNSEIFRQFVSSICANLLTISQGTANAWLSANFVTLQRSNTDLPCGPLTLHEATLVMSIVYVGAIVGNLAAPHLVRKFGCKRVLLVLGYPQILYWILIIYADNAYYLYVANILEGFITACLVVSMPMFSIEISHDGSRGAINAVHDPSYYFGTVGTFLLAHHYSIIDQAKILLVVPILFVILFAWIPQTPQHLLKTNNEKAASEANQFFKGTKLDILPETKTETIKSNSELTMSDFTNPRARRAICLSLLLMCLFSLQGMSVLLTYLTEIFTSMNPDFSPLYASMITTVMVMIGSLIFMNLVERINRRTLYICSAIATTLGLTAFAVYLHFLKDDHTFAWLPVVCLSCVLFSNCLGMAPITWLVILEIMPKKIKEFGYSTAYLLILCSGFVFTELYPLLKEQIGLVGWIVVFAVACFCSAIFGYFFIPETRGKSHEEIMEILAE